jgi:hypothetical protein
VGDGDAVCALDWEWEAVVVAVDGGPMPRRRSGEVRRAEQRKVCKMCVCQSKSECLRRSRTCSGSRIRCGRVGARADSRRRAWWPRARFGQRRG